MSAEDDGTVTAASLRVEHLLALPPQGGVITFAGERVLLFDAIAMGMLRHQLVDLLGVAAARGLFTHFGYLHGWRTADTLKDALPWKSEREWRVAGGRLHRLQGLVSFEPIVREQRPGEPPVPFAEGLWHDSYEADEHLRHLGRSDVPVCWASTGFASGYLTRVTGRTIYCVETSCRARGDAVCRMEGRPKELWEPERQADFVYFEQESLGEQLERMLNALKKAERKLKPFTERLRADADDPSGLVVRSAAFHAVVDQAKRLAPFDVTMLLTGEAGVGKKALAKLVHELSPRQAGPFVTIKCGAVPEAVLEAELFGSKSGTESGRRGVFTDARTGTLLLDDVCALPFALQGRLLAVLKDRDDRPGAELGHRDDLRVLAACKHDLHAEVQAGRFRKDLYYRLKVIELNVPPLRARVDDVLPLARLALAEDAAHSGGPPKQLSHAAQHCLLEYGWPGNVTELKAALSRAALVTEGPRIEVANLPPELARSPAHVPPSGGKVLTLAEVEREHVLKTLAALGGDTQAAAAQLGISVSDLAKKLRLHR